MKKNKLLLCEKPSAAKCYQFLLEKDDLAMIACGTASYKFDYGELKFSEAPYTNIEPQYKAYNEANENSLTIKTLSRNSFFENKTLKKILQLKNEEIVNVQELEKTIDCFLSSFDEIIFACDSDVTGVRGFIFKMEKFFNLGTDWRSILNNKGIKITAIHTGALDKETLEICYKNRIDIDKSEMFKYFKEAYIKKDFFEYNYNINSLLLINDALDLPEYLKIKKDFILTRNYIAILFLIKNTDELSSDFNHSILNGKGIGTIISHCVIIENLLKIGLIKLDKENQLTNKYDRIYYQYITTELGDGFLNNLHKKINDPYLGKRVCSDIGHGWDNIQNFNNLSIENFKIKYEQYLYTVFSKQKRFLRAKKKKVPTATLR